jgi:hypothetical protein
MVSTSYAGSLLLLDQRGEDSRRAVDHRRLERRPEDHDAGPVAQRPDELTLDLAGARQRPGIDEHVLDDVGGVRVVGQFRLLLADRPEVLQVAVGGGEPGCHSSHARSPRAPTGP